MKLSPEERRAVNIENASKSTGPRTAEGKARARGNALRHGLRAELLPLPGEDQAVAAARAEAWNDHYRPASPAARHLVNECARATLLADRVHDQYHAAVSRQVRRAREDWFRDREDQVARLTRMLQTDPAAARACLAHTPEGCDALLERWEALSWSLAENGHWADDELTEALRLFGFSNLLDPSGRCRRRWTTRLMNALCTDPRPVYTINRLMAAQAAPESLRTFYTENPPEPEDARHALQVMVDEECQWLRGARDRIRDEFDQADLDESETRARTLRDPSEARLFLRYQAEARSAFHRNFTALVKTLDRDAAAGDHADDLAEPCPDDPPAVSPNEPILEPPTRAEVEPSDRPARDDPAFAPAVASAPAVEPVVPAASPNGPNAGAAPSDDPDDPAPAVAVAVEPVVPAASPNEPNAGATPSDDPDDPAKHWAYPMLLEVCSYSPDEGATRPRRRRRKPTAAAAGAPGDPVPA